MVSENCTCSIPMVNPNSEVNTKDNNGHSPLFHATGMGNEVMVKILVSRDDFEVDTKDKDGHVLLSYTAEYGNELVVKMIDPCRAG